jgi:hypothetical protein
MDDVCDVVFDQHRRLGAYLTFEYVAQSLYVHADTFSRYVGVDGIEVEAVAKIVRKSMPNEAQSFDILLGQYVFPLWIR